MRPRRCRVKLSAASAGKSWDIYDPDNNQNNKGHIWYFPTVSELSGTAS